jgi:hypothetical protein
MGKRDQATPPVSAHGSGIAISVKINHLEIEILNFFEEHQAVRAYAESAVTDVFDKLDIILWEKILSIVNNDKVISRTLVFEKFDFHEANLGIIKVQLRC